MMQPSRVCVFSERQDVAIELLAVARGLAGTGTVASIVVEPDGEQAAREQIAHGANTVFVVQPGNGADPAEVQLDALRQTLAGHEPDIVLIGATVHGTEIASRFAQRQGLGCVSECTRLDRRDGAPVGEPRLLLRVARGLADGDLKRLIDTLVRAGVPRNRIETRPNEPKKAAGRPE